MSTITPISTGPVAETGQSESSQNAITHGLSSSRHLVHPEDAAEFEAFSAAIKNDLRPETAFENTYAREIVRASWRLELCARAEDTATGDSTQPAIDRARSGALNILLKATAEFRRLYTNRRIGVELYPAGTDITDQGIATQKEITTARINHERRLELTRKAGQPAPAPAIDPLDSLVLDAERRFSEEDDLENTETTPPVSFCKTATPRNSPCPCGSKNKYKRCCGTGVPPVLHHGSQKPVPRAA